MINGFYGIMDFSITDTGPFSARLSTNICWFNNTPNTYTIHSFLGLDIDLNGTAAGDFGLPTDFSNGRKITIQDGFTTGVLASAPPFASGSAQSSVAGVLGALNNGAVNSYTSDPGSAGGLNDAWLMQRTNLMNPFGSGLCTPTTLDISIAVPEPGTLLALTLGSLAALRRRR